MSNRDVYYDIGSIVSDDHAVELINKLTQAANVRHIRFRLDKETNFTNEGLNAIGKSMRGLVELETLCVEKIWGSPLSSESLAEVVKVLYLEGNLNDIRKIIIRDERAQFLFDCFRVGRDDEQVEEYSIPAKTPRHWTRIPQRRWGGSMEFAACLHGNTQLQKLEVTIESTMYTQEEASALAAAMCNSQVTTLCIKNDSPRVIMKGDTLRTFFRDGIQASGRVWDSVDIEASFALIDDISPVVEVIPFVKALRISRLGDTDCKHPPQTKDDMRCLYAGLEHSCNLVCLELVQCRLDADDMEILCKALRHHGSLKALDLSDNNFGDSCVAAFVEHWGEHSVLKWLSFCRNMIGPTGMTVLSKALRCHSMLMELHLGQNKIGDAGVAAFVKHWDERSVLESLTLIHNGIGSIGVQQLMHSVVNRPSMKSLELGYALDCSTLQMIGELLPNLRLQKLELVGYPANKVEQQRAYQSLLRGLKANHYLRELRLSDLFINDFGKELAFYIALGKHGRYLVADINAVEPTVWCTILAKCGRHVDFNNSMIFYFLREQPHLVRRALSGIGVKRRLFSISSAS